MQGYKFETLCLLPSTWSATPRDYIEGREDEIVSNRAQYCSIVKTGIGKARMILGGEVDAGTRLLTSGLAALTIFSVGCQTCPGRSPHQLGGAQDIGFDTERARHAQV